MMKNIFVKMLIMSIIFCMPYIKATIVAQYNAEKNIIELTHTLEVNAGPHVDNYIPTTTIFTPAAPYNNVTCVITMPSHICVGQKFTIDYALKVRSFTHISFWADILPDSGTSGLKYISSSVPAHGNLDISAESLLRNGGSGFWNFPQGLPTGSYHVTLTLQAMSPGIKTYITVLATNPPSYISPVSHIVAQ